MPNICLFAEVLTHIRQLTLHASLQTSGDEAPRIDVSSDKKVITVVHGNESSSLFLPTQISGTANITFSSPQKTELTARVQIEDHVAWREFDQNAVEAPWDAADLSQESGIQCQNCRTTLLIPGTVTQWKDLPNQDWADIMDLWYCHKPHEHHDNDEQKQAAEAKGYSATSKLASTPGTGMVDVVSFVLHPDDCRDLRFPDRVNKNDLMPQKVSCSACKTTVGAFSATDNLIKLYKSNLAVRRATGELYHSFPASTFICAQLSSLVESSPIRKVVVHSINEEDPAAVDCQELKHGTGSDKSTNSNLAIDDESSNQQRTGQAKLFSSADKTDNMTQQYSTHEIPSAATTGEPGTNPPRPPRSLAATVEEAPTSPEEQSRPTVNQDHQASHKSDAASINTPPNARGKSNSDTNTATDREPPAPKGLLLWIFNPNIYYSSSLHPSNRLQTRTDNGPATTSTTTSTPAKAHRAMKIFYRGLDDPQFHLDNTPATQIEEIQLPTHRDTTSLYTSLMASTRILPLSMRRFQDWEVGLLDRYERVATAEEVMGENPLSRKPGDDGHLGGDASRVTKLDLPAGYQELYL